MQRKHIFILTFSLVALVQIYVPAKMVYDSEHVLIAGKDFKFKTAPVDPTDPFRGKYITLRYDIDRFNVISDDDWPNDEKIYVHLTEDSLGYAKIIDVTKDRPDNGVDYVDATVRYSHPINQPNASVRRLRIKYSFDRYYMEESKAYDAEIAYRNSLRNRTGDTYTLVTIKDGKPVIKDVLLNGVPIREVVIRNQANEE